jgi:Ser/Thr protein kinase RdoA (MazF antagonist)
MIKVHLPSDKSAESVAREVLARYPLHLASANVFALGNHGGFSGARVWRVVAAGSCFCLRASSPDFSAERLQWIHDLISVARKTLSFVPEVFATRGGTTWVERSGRLWELSNWLSGRADFREKPSVARLGACCEALGQLHAVWSGASTGAITAHCPAIARRLDRARAWRNLVAGGWQPDFSSLSSRDLRLWAVRAWDLLRFWAQRVPTLLDVWKRRPFPLQPCLCDIWHDHVFFDGEAFQGFIDFGGVKIDHVGVDLARMLGSMVGDDISMREFGLSAYSRARVLSDEERSLIADLDRSGTIIGMQNWLRWLYWDKRSFDNTDGPAKRLRALVERVEKWDDIELGG